MGAAPAVFAPDAAVLLRLANRIPSMLAYWDTEMRCRFANRAYERWFGVSPESLYGAHIRDLLGPALFEKNRPYIEAALRGEPQEFERDIPDPAGGPVRHSLANYIPDVDNGTVRGFFVIVTDVSELHRARAKLEQARSKFAGILEMSSDAIITTDAEQRITMFSHGAESIFGYPRDEVVGQSIELLIPEPLRAAHRGHVARFIAGSQHARPMGQRFSTTLVGVRKDGEQFPAEASISKLDTPEGLVLTVALRDVSERKALEREQTILAEAGSVLGSSLEIERTLAATAQLVTRHLAELCIIDLLQEGGTVKRLVAHANPALATVCAQLAARPVDVRHTLGRLAMETREHEIHDVITHDMIDAGAQDAEQARLVKELDPHSALVIPLLTPDRVLGALILGASRPHRFAGADVRIATELGQRAALAIENAQLYDAARRATQARDEVLGIVAHDVRSPLNTIRLATTTLARQSCVAETPRARAAVELIDQSLARANRLISDLLDVRRIEAGVLAVACVAIDPDTILTDAVRAFEPSATAAGIHLVREDTRALPRIHGDRDRVLQVLENLIGNALKFTPAGGRIVVRTAAALDGLRFSVSDTGAGIRAEDLPHLFDRFWQAERARRDGAGLGLAICKGIVEAHGGRIWVESTPGAGTTVSFIIPLAG